jgi:hypothetical protein
MIHFPLFFVVVDAAKALVIAARQRGWQIVRVPFFSGDQA